MTNAELAVLSLVVERPRHGYEIEQVIAERGMRDWTDVGFSSIYYLLGKMEKAGLACRAQDARAAGTGAQGLRAHGRGARGVAAASLEALSAPRRSTRSCSASRNLPGLPRTRRSTALRAYRSAARRAARRDAREAGAAGAARVVRGRAVRLQREPVRAEMTGSTA